MLALLVLLVLLIRLLFGVLVLGSALGLCESAMAEMVVHDRRATRLTSFSALRRALRSSLVSSALGSSALGSSTLVSAAALDCRSQPQYIILQHTSTHLLLSLATSLAFLLGLSDLLPDLLDGLGSSELGLIVSFVFSSLPLPPSWPACGPCAPPWSRCRCSLSRISEWCC